MFVTIRMLSILVLVAGCTGNDPAPPPSQVEAVDTGKLAASRIFFGHQSVGRDLLAGIAMIAPGLRIVPASTAPPTGGALIEGQIGQNQHPESKDRAFLDALTGLGAIDLALYKYCYVDVGPDTDPGELLAAYARTLEGASVRTVAVTLPLTTVEPGWKRWLKQIAGRETQLELNARRMQFNEALRARYGEAGIIDLARMQSTREDGSRCLVRADGIDVECLVPWFTDDGAHLNERGRRTVAERFVIRLRDIDAARP